MYAPTLYLPARQCWLIGPCTSQDSWGWTLPVDSWLVVFRLKPDRLTTKNTFSINHSFTVKPTENRAPSYRKFLSHRLLWIWAKSSKLLDVVMRMVRKLCRLSRIAFWLDHSEVQWRKSLSLSPAVVKTTVLLADMNDFTTVNDVYKQCECNLYYFSFAICGMIHGKKQGLIVTTIVPHLSIQTLPLGVTTTQGTCIDQG